MRICKGPCFCTGACRETPEQTKAKREFQSAFEQARAIAAPASWPWPMSEEARKWVEFVAQSQKPAHERQFDKQAHEEFMRGL